MGIFFYITLFWQALYSLYIASCCNRGEISEFFGNWIEKVIDSIIDERNLRKIVLDVEQNYIWYRSKWYELLWC